MTQPAEPSADCKAPKPPRDLAETAYIRNGYRAILRIMAAEKWRETGSCECFLETITWEDVVAKSEDFVSSESQRRPFDVVLLDQHATGMEAERQSVCAAN